MARTQYVFELIYELKEACDNIAHQAKTVGDMEISMWREFIQQFTWGPLKYDKDIGFCVDLYGPELPDGDLLHRKIEVDGIDGLYLFDDEGLFTDIPEERRAKIADKLEELARVVRGGC